MTPKHNLDAILVGTGEFSFCEGATSASNAILKGYRDVGNIVAFTPETENTVEEHEGSYRGRKIVDKKFSTKQKLEYLLTQDEFKVSNLRFLFMADDATGHTQDALTLSAGDSMAFTSDLPGAVDKWYDIYKDSARKRACTQIALATETPAVSVTADATTNLITENTHGRLAGDKVIVGGSVAPGGLTLGGVYYVVTVLTNTYSLALTAGGTAIDLTTAGTSVTIREALKEDVDFEVDLTLGRVRFLVAQTGTLYPLITCPAIADGDAGYFHAIDPLENPTREGFGRLIIFDEDADNEVVLDHVDFSCTITAEKSNSIDGKKPAEFQVRVTVTKDVGTIFVRNDNDEPA
jgi:hypothetical protein